MYAWAYLKYLNKYAYVAANVKYGVPYLKGPLSTPSEEGNFLGRYLKSVWWNNVICIRSISFVQSCILALHKFPTHLAIFRDVTEWFSCTDYNICMEMSSHGMKPWNHFCRNGVCFRALFRILYCHLPVGRKGRLKLSITLGQPVHVNVADLNITKWDWSF